jgi:hypothetical protein
MSLVLGPILAGGCRDANEATDPSEFPWAVDTVVIIGSLDGEEHETFGQLMTGALSETFGLFVVDLQGRTVLWYSSDGRFLGPVAGRGQGPGELGLPWDVHIGADGTLLVLDNENARLSIYSVEKERAVFERSVPSTFPTGTLCSLDDGVFLGTFRSGHVLHELGSEGRVVRSLGPAPQLEGADSYGAFRALAESQSFASRVYCAHREGVVLVALSSHPSVRAFERDGSLKWETELAEIHPVRFTVTESGAFQAEMDSASGTNFLRSILRWDEETVLLQYELRRSDTPPDEGDFHSLDSRLLRIETGEEVLRTWDLPWIVGRSGDRLALFSNVPYPRVTLVDLKY